MVAEKFKVKGYLDYRELLNQSDVDAVVVASPDHWHGKMAMDAMDKGKDVYLEKPMVHTNEEARQLVDTVKETKRILQVGSQTTSADIWWKAKKAIADGMIGQMIESQGSYHRNGTEGEWNWPIDAGAGPDGKGDDFYRLEHVARFPVQAGSQAPLGCRPLLPLPQVLGLFPGHRQRPLLSRDRAAQHLLGRAAVPHQGDGHRRHLRLQETARRQAGPRSAGHLPPAGRIRQGPLPGAEFLDGQRHPYPRHDPRA